MLLFICCCFCFSFSFTFIHMFIYILFVCLFFRCIDANSRPSLIEKIFLIVGMLCFFAMGMFIKFVFAITLFYIRYIFGKKQKKSNKNRTTLKCSTSSSLKTEFKCRENFDHSKFHFFLTYENSVSVNIFHFLLLFTSCSFCCYFFFPI